MNNDNTTIQVDETTKQVFEEFQSNHKNTKDSIMH